MIAKISRTLLAFLGLLSIASTALGQGNTFNPYGNSGYADYREFGNAMVSNNPALPGQSVLNNTPLVGRPRANSFENYANELDSLGSDPVIQRRASSNLPYYMAYERLNQDPNRAYKPNREADKGFYERQKQRDLAYLQAMSEKDPVKRAKLLRQVEQYSLDRSAPSRSGTTKAAPAPNPNGNGSPATARSSAPVERRQPAPNPFAPEIPRRPSTTRAPAPPLGRSTTTPPPPISRTDNARSRPAPDPDASTIPTPPPR